MTPATKTAYYLWLHQNNTTDAQTPYEQKIQQESFLGGYIEGAKSAPAAPAPTCRNCPEDVACTSRARGLCGSISATPAPADAASAEVLEWLPGDKAVVEAVRQQSGTHKGVYLSSKAAKRLLRLIDATPTPAPATVAPGAAGEALEAVQDAVDKWATQHPHLLDNETHSELMEYLYAALTTSETIAAPAAPEAGPVGGVFVCECCHGESARNEEQACDGCNGRGLV